VDLSSILFLPERLVERMAFTDGDYERMTLLICYLKDLPAGCKTIVFSNTIKACKRIQYFI
jgi:superfamily II DNA/RNA helicase